MKYYSKTLFRGCPGLPQIVGFEERRWNGKETSSKIRKSFSRPGEANLTYFKTQNPRNVLIVRRRHNLGCISGRKIDQVYHDILDIEVGRTE